jgi:hypothetical protein
VTELLEVAPATIVSLSRLSSSRAAFIASAFLV